MLAPPRCSFLLVAFWAAAPACVVACSDPPPAGASAAARWTVADLTPRTELVPHELFPHVDRLYAYDPACVLRLRPDGRKKWGWREHEDGVIRVTVNNLGFLECMPTVELATTPRVLIAGDSHLMVVPCDESFPNVLEERLRATDGIPCELINAGVGYTSPALHLLRLRHFASLRPDVFVLTVFTGNDFLDQLDLDFDLARSPRPDLPADHRERLRLCQQDYPGPLQQGLNQVHFFARWPGTRELALGRILEVLQEAATHCAQQGIAFLVLLLPTKFDVDSDDSVTMTAAARTLDLPEEALGDSRRLAEELAQGLAERGIACLDPLPTMRASPAPCYWRKDYHLSTAGHRAVAEALHGPLRELVARVSRPR